MSIDPRPVGTPRRAVEYVLPLRWTDDGGLDELSDYLEALATWVDVTVVDGSPREVFDRHAERWSAIVRRVRPEPLEARNGSTYSARAVMPRPRGAGARSSCPRARPRAAACQPSRRGRGTPRPRT